MSSEQKQRMRLMRESGCTYQQIADEYGVSRQYVHQTLRPKRKTPRGKRIVCVYPNVAAWMTEHDMSATKIASAIGVNLQTFLSIARGNGITKYTIDKLLALTGMTYEKFFEK